MREIKFRAFYKGERYPIFEGGLEEYEKPRMIYNIQDIYDGSGADDSGNGVGRVSCFGSFLDDEDYIVMQYTGLKDKNGVEIYEGDVVRNSGLWLLRSTNKLQYGKQEYGGGEKFVVNLNVTGVELRHRDDWNGNVQKDFAPHGFNSKPYVDSHDAWNLQKTLEVIGNIYENPELLGDSQ